VNRRSDNEATFLTVASFFQKRQENAREEAVAEACFDWRFAPIWPREHGRI
jgi:hypothetical protein